MALASGIELAERGKLPDLAVRLGIRRLLAQRLADEGRGGLEAVDGRMRTLLKRSWQSEIAVQAASANAQHYEVPAMFFEIALGPHLKYSSAYFPPGTNTLGDAEAAMLALSADRAEIEDGMRVLDLGCGWGSMSLFLLERFPGLRVTAVSNSHSQRQYILRRAEGLRVSDRLTLITSDVSTLELPPGFDRVISVEMLEHVRNHGALFERIAECLRPGGKLFVHVFCHRTLAYLFETGGADNWMGRNFFTGGMMPSFDYLTFFQQALTLEERWAVGGEHYSRTARAWLHNIDADKRAVLEVFGQTYGPPNAELWHNRWRIFFMACEELWGYGGGGEWHVGHYRFVRR